MSDWIAGLQKTIAPSTPPKGSFTVHDVSKRLKCPITTAGDYCRKGVANGDLGRVKIKPAGSRHHVFYYFEK